MTTAIYEPKGRAKEYAGLACNLYRGCGHQCVYCYAPSATFQDRISFGNPEPRKGILEALQKDASKLAQKNETRSVLLCFSTDPYQPINDEYQLTHQAIQILQDSGQKVTILTKGGHRSLPDIELLRPGLDEYAATLTFMDEESSEKWEPGADPPIERFYALKTAHDRGIYTWASLEPVIDPEESLAIIRATFSVVDEFKLGILNHHPQAELIDWPSYAKAAIALVKETGRKVYIKDDLKKYV